VIGEVKSSKGAKTAFSKQLDMSEGEEALRKKAAKMGADAVIDVKLDRGVSFWSWKAVKGTGTAIAWEDQDAEAPAAS
jgi:uncharacterized protein YbjQ (UPF0145 family)